MVIAIVIIAAVMLWCVTTVAWDRYHNPGEGVADFDPVATRSDEWSNN